MVKEEPTVERVRSGKWWVTEEVNLLSFPGQNELGQQGLILSWNLPLQALGGFWGGAGQQDWS